MSDVVMLVCILSVRRWLCIYVWFIFVFLYKSPLFKMRMVATTLNFSVQLSAERCASKSHMRMHIVYG